MQVKKDLNNIQRKMLDEIYTEQFEKKVKLIREERQAGYNKLQKQLVSKEAKNKDVKAMLEAGAKFYRAEEKLRTRLSSVGVQVNQRLNQSPELVVGGYRTTGEYKELVAYQAETNRIELKLGEKKKEMRAKIYGVSASYEDVEKEVNEILKDI